MKDDHVHGSDSLAAAPESEPAAHRCQRKRTSPGSQPRSSGAPYPLSLAATAWELVAPSTPRQLPHLHRHRERDCVRDDPAFHRRSPSAGADPNPRSRQRARDRARPAPRAGRTSRPSRAHARDTTGTPTPSVASTGTGPGWGRRAASSPGPDPSRARARDALSRRHTLAHRRRVLELRRRTVVNRRRVVGAPHGDLQAFRPRRLG